MSEKGESDVLNVAFNENHQEDGSDLGFRKWPSKNIASRESERKKPVDKEQAKGNEIVPDVHFGGVCGKVNGLFLFGKVQGICMLGIVAETPLSF